MEECKNNRGRDLQRPCTHVGRNSTEVERIGVHGIFERKEFGIDISKVYKSNVKVST